MLAMNALNLAKHKQNKVLHKKYTGKNYDFCVQPDYTQNLNKPYLTKTHKLNSNFTNNPVI